MRASSLLCVGLLAASARAQAPLLPRPEYPAGATPAWVAAADMNGDGRPDVVTANSASNDVSILLDAAQGSLAPAAHFAVSGIHPVCLALGDLNGDGNLDVVTAGAFTASLSVLLGNGAGALGAAASFPTGALPASLALGDATGDGALDVVCADTLACQVTLHPGVGNGALGAAAAIVSFPPGDRPSHVELADVNADGMLDVLVSHSDSVARLLGAGGGAFGPALDVSFGALFPGASPRAAGFADGDVNLDGALDLAMQVGAYSNCIPAGCSDFAASLIVLAGDGAGGFAISTAASAGHPANAQVAPPVVLADLDGDGVLDAVLAGSEGLWVFYAAFLGAPGVSFGAPAGPFALSDLDLDGHVDATIAGNGVVSVLRGTRAGGFQDAPTFAVGTLPISVALGDLNADGRPDALVANASGAPPDFSLLLGDGLGGFLPAASVSVGAIFLPQHVVLGDLNGDGRLDAVTCSGQSGPAMITVLLGDGAGGFAASRGVSLPAPGVAHAVALADFDLDGRTDVATANGAGNFAYLLLGNGAGGLGAPHGFGSGGFNVSCVAAADVNGDGKPDLAVLNRSSSNVSILLGDGSGGLAQIASPNVGPTLSEEPLWVALGDVSGDGRPDVVTANSETSDASVFLGDGAGHWSGPSMLKTGFTPSYVAMIDLDGDGRVDLLTFNSSIRDLSWFRGDGVGGFDGARNFFVGGAPPSASSAIAAGDLDGDGRPDLVVTSGLAPSSVTVLRNLGAPIAGTSIYGAGTPGCGGVLGIGANAPPNVNSSAFALTCTNAPKNAVGLGLIANVQDAAGSDPLGLGLTLHVDLLASSLVVGVSFFSDAGGTGHAPAPIPNNSALAGATLFAQGVFADSPALGCSAAALHLASTRGFAFTIH